MMILKHKVIQGTRWVGAAQVVQVAFQFVVTAILARLLSPNDFGLLAMVFVFTNIATIFSDLGLTAAIIQRKDCDEVLLCSTFWINILAGIIIMFVLCILAPLIGFFYNEHRLTLITIALSSVSFISSFGSIQTALLTREMNFRALSLIKILCLAIAGAVSITMALLGFGVWSLVYQAIVASLMTSIFLWKFSKWRPSFIFSWLRAKDIFGFGLNLTGFNIINYMSRNVDNLLVGKFLGASLLGIYNLAYKLLLFPLSNISQVVGIVLFPTLSTVQHEKNKLRIAYLRAVRYIALITFPLMVGLFIVAPQFIRVFFGAKWERSIILVQLFSFVGLFQSVGTLNGSIYQSQGRTDLQLRVGVIFTTLTVFSFIIGLQWSVEGVAICYTIVSFLLIYPALSIPFKLIELKFSQFFRQLKTIFFATIAMGICIFILHTFLEGYKCVNDLFILVLLVIFGVVSYISFLFLLDKEFIKEVFGLIIWRPRWFSL